MRARTHTDSTKCGTPLGDATSAANVVAQQSSQRCAGAMKPPARAVASPSGPKSGDELAQATPSSMPSTPTKENLPQGTLEQRDIEPKVMLDDKISFPAVTAALESE